MATLKEKLEDPKVYEAVVQDCMRVLDEEVSKKSGISGLAIKAAYKLLKGVQHGNALRKVIEHLMPDFMNTLEPYYGRYLQAGKGRTWTDFLRPDFESITDQFLAITDTKSQQSDSQAVKSTYAKLRPKARKEVVSSLPNLARMMEKYLDKP
jgi:hypothetical protein